MIMPQNNLNMFTFKKSLYRNNQYVIYKDLLIWGYIQPDKTNLKKSKITDLQDLSFDELLQLVESIKNFKFYVTK